jgi:hypothetical protein
MGDGREQGRRGCPHLARRRVGYHEVGVLGLEGAQLAHQCVVLAVGDLGIVQPVISVVVVLDEGTKLLDSGHRVEPLG